MRAVDGMIFGNPDTLARMETPCVVVAVSRLQSNIARMQSLADKHGVSLRPHVKTHKCPEIARMQLAAGATGLTCSKSEEAAAFLDAKFEDILVAYPLYDSRALDRTLDTARPVRARLTTLAGDMATAVFLAEQAKRHGVTLPVFIKIDVGLHRVGLPADHPELVPLARSISEASSLELAGVLSHAGHAYGASSLEEIRAIAQAEAQDMALAKSRIEAAGMEVHTVSVGATPTVLTAASFEGIDEIRPGNYVFLDTTAMRLGIATQNEIALCVLSTVVAVNDVHVVVDAGSKALSSDKGPHGVRGIGGYGAVVDLAGNPCGVLAKLSEEHGFIARVDAPDLGIGDRVLVTPNHACSTANQAPCLHAVGMDAMGSSGIETPPWPSWDVVARGTIR